MMAYDAKYWGSNAAAGKPVPREKDAGRGGPDSWSRGALEAWKSRAMASAIVADKRRVQRDIIEPARAAGRDVSHMEWRMDPRWPRLTPRGFAAWIGRRLPEAQIHLVKELGYPDDPAAYPDAWPKGMEITRYEPPPADPSRARMAVA